MTTDGQDYDYDARQCDSYVHALVNAAAELCTPRPAHQEPVARLAREDWRILLDELGLDYDKSYVMLEMPSGAKLRVTFTGDKPGTALIGPLAPYQRVLLPPRHSCARCGTRFDKKQGMRLCSDACEAASYRDQDAAVFADKMRRKRAGV